MDIVIGTAGHIDHGKTSLVKSLTGVDADRLPEEKQRGITIDLGFAELDLGDLHVGFVDVPGHEKFVKNMLAGASGIDLVVLVVAADEGVMPQTREHFEICRLLNVPSGFVVLTKSDLVDAETLELAKMDVAELVDGSFLENAPVIPFSSRTGEGTNEVITAIRETAATIVRAVDQRVLRLPIDRSFSVRGFGAVVTGTLVSGAIAEGDELELMPTGKKVRVRGLQTHGKQVRSARAGQRTAVNLAGIDHADIERGMTLCEIGALQPTQVIDARIEVLASARSGVRSRQRVRVHIGTAEVLARVSVLNAVGAITPGHSDLVQLRLESPIVAVPGERFIIRSYSPQVTIAGGVVIDAMAARHRRKDLDDVRKRLLNLVESGLDAATQVTTIIGTTGQNATTIDDLRVRTGIRTERLSELVAAMLTQGSIVAAGEYLMYADAFRDLSASATNAVTDFHRQQPLERGIGLESLRDKVAKHTPSLFFKHLLAALETENKLIAESDTVRLANHRSEFSPAERQVRDRLSEIYRAAGFEVPRLEDALTAAATGLGLKPEQTRTVFKTFLNSGEIVKVTDEFYFLRSEIERLVAMLKAHAEKGADRTIDVPRFKEIAGVSRKYAIPLLEYFDRERITRRAGDKRIIL